MLNKSKISNAKKLLLSIADQILDVSFRSADALIFSYGSARILASKMNFQQKQYYSAMDGLRRHGYVKKINKDQFLITPKALAQIRIFKVWTSEPVRKKWDGQWCLVVFDIPEPKKRARNIYRSLLKRKGFIGIQNSVFVAPFADFEELALLREELKIEKYVSFFIAKSDQTDDDSALRKKFGLL